MLENPSYTTIFLHKILQTPVASEPHQILPWPALTSTFHLFPVLQICYDHHCLPLAFAAATGAGRGSTAPITLAAASSTLPLMAIPYKTTSPSKVSTSNPFFPPPASPAACYLGYAQILSGVQSCQTSSFGSSSSNKIICLIDAETQTLK